MSFSPQKTPAMESVFWARSAIVERPEEFVHRRPVVRSLEVYSLAQSQGSDVYSKAPQRVEAQAVLGVLCELGCMTGAIGGHHLNSGKEEGS